MGPEYIDDMAERLDAIEASLVATLTTRVISRNLRQDPEDYSTTDREKGIVQIVSAGESDYLDGPGTVAREGHHKILLACWLQVPDSSTPGAAVEQAELALIAELKAWARQGFTNIGLKVESVEHSKQLVAPWGWCAIALDVGPKL